MTEDWDHLAALMRANTEAFERLSAEVEKLRVDLEALADKLSRTCEANGLWDGS